jgi:hypothetical protein
LLLLAEKNKKEKERGRKGGKGEESTFTFSSTLLHFCTNIDMIGVTMAYLHFYKLITIGEKEMAIKLPELEM